MLLVCWSLLRNARQFSKLLTQGSLHSIVWLQTKGSCAGVVLSALRDSAADTKDTQLVHPSARCEHPFLRQAVQSG